jgi:hypothetical protein
MLGSNGLPDVGTSLAISTPRTEAVPAKKPHDGGRAGRCRHRKRAQLAGLLIAAVVIASLLPSLDWRSPCHSPNRLDRAAPARTAIRHRARSACAARARRTRFRSRRTGPVAPSPHPRQAVASPLRKALHSDRFQDASSSSLCNTASFLFSSATWAACWTYSIGCEFLVRNTASFV